MRRRSGYHMAKSARTFTHSPALVLRMAARARCTFCCGAAGVGQHSTSCKAPNTATELSSMEMKRGSDCRNPASAKLRDRLNFALQQERDDERIECQGLDERECDDHRGEKLPSAVGVAADRFHRGGADFSLTECATECGNTDTDIRGKRDESRGRRMTTASRRTFLRHRQQRRREHHDRDRPKHS